MNVAWTQAAEGLPRRAFTVEDVRRMVDAGVISEGERIELIGGDIVVLEHNRVAHDLIKNVLAVAMVRAAPQEFLVGVATTLQLTDCSLVDADIAVVRHAGYKSSKSGFAQPQSSDVLLVIEIAGETLHYDRDIKSRLYSRYGVGEFWLIEPNERVTWVYTQPSGETWSSIVERGPNEILTTPALPGFSIRLADID